MIIMLLALFAVCLLLWGLILFGGETPYSRHAGLLAWLSVLFLGLLIVLSGFGVVTWRSVP
jgi:hypothetical protein